MVFQFYIKKGKINGIEHAGGVRRCVASIRDRSSDLISSLGKLDFGPNFCVGLKMISFKNRHLASLCCHRLHRRGGQHWREQLRCQTRLRNSPYPCIHIPMNAYGIVSLIASEQFAKNPPPRRIGKTSNMVRNMDVWKSGYLDICILVKTVCCCILIRTSLSVSYTHLTLPTKA